MADNFVTTDWHVTQLTPEAALAFDRRAYNVPDATILGWTPYTFRVTYRAIAQFACHTEAEFNAWLNRSDLLVINWGPWRDGVRACYLGRVKDSTALQGAHITLEWEGRTLLGEVTSAHEVAGETRLRVRHFNGEPWPVQPAVDAVTVLPRD